MFDEITERDRGDAKKRCSIRLAARPSGRPSCIVGIRSIMMAMLDWKDCDVVVLIGRDADAGKMRLRKVPRESGVATLRRLRSNAASVDLGHIAAFGNRPTETIGVDARLVDGMLEIELPDWAAVSAEQDDRDAVRPPKSAFPKPAGASKWPPDESAPAPTPAPTPRPSPPNVGKKPIAELGITVDFSRQAILYKGRRLDLSPRQADFLGELVRARGQIVLTGKLIEAMRLPESGGASLVTDVRAELAAPLKDGLDLVLRYVPKFGYSLNKQ